MIALGGPKLKLKGFMRFSLRKLVSMIALGGPKLKPVSSSPSAARAFGFNDSTGWA